MESRFWTTDGLGAPAGLPILIGLMGGQGGEGGGGYGGGGGGRGTDAAAKDLGGGVDHDVALPYTVPSSNTGLGYVMIIFPES